MDFKKFLLAAVFALAGIAGAAEPPKAACPAANPYESIMPCIWADAPDYQMTSPTYGVKVGILGCFGAPVYGVEAAVIAAGSDEVCGFKGSLIYTDGKKAAGILLAPVNLVEEFSGVSFGVFNKAKKGCVQFGIINCMENGFLPWFPIVNIGW